MCLCVCVRVCFYHKALGFNPVVLCCIKFQTWINCGTNCDVIYMPMSDYTLQCNSYVFVYLCTHTPRQQSSFSGRSNKPGLNILFCSQMWSAALRLTHTHTRASIHARSWKTTSQSDLLLHHYGNIMRRRRRKKKHTHTHLAAWLVMTACNRSFWRACTCTNANPTASERAGNQYACWQTASPVREEQSSPWVLWAQSGQRWRVHGWKSSGPAFERGGHSDLTINNVLLLW